jgi:DNA-binding transcriptional LysR family regulator
MELEWINDFMEVAKHGSFTDAARVRGLNQSSLSRRVRALEEWCGSRLLDRGVSPLRLTPQGEIFLDAARGVTSELRRVQSDIKAHAASLRETIRIHALHTLAATFVPFFLRVIRDQLHADEFELKTSIFADNIQNCVDAICYYDAHFMITYEAEGRPIILPSDVPPGKLESIRIARDSLVPVCSNEKYKVIGPRLGSSASTKIPLATYSEGTYLSSLVDRKVEQLGLGDRLEVVDDAQMSETLRNLARHDHGIAWVLLSTANEAISRGKLRQLTFGQGDSHIDLDIRLFRATDNTSPDMERIWKLSKTLEKQLSTTPSMTFDSPVDV